VAPNNNEHSPGEVTGLLQSWADGDAGALEKLWPLVYDDVRRLARRQMARERGDHTLQGTALVNEAFIRLSGQRVLEWQNREQFLSLAAQIMRRVLVDHARRACTIPRRPSRSMRCRRWILSMTIGWMCSPSMRR
jgi:RNA polymerase sigma factor (TIGR02999 family)